MALIKVFLFAVCYVMTTKSTHQTEIQNDLPQISFDNLRNHLHNQAPKPNYFDKLKDGGGKFSAFVISDLDKVYSQALIDFQSRAPSCMKSIAKNQVFNLPLNENSHRITFATLTKNFPDCLDHSIMSDTFDQVDPLVSKLLEVITNKELDYIVDSNIYNIFDAPVKDHVHVYFNNITSWDHRRSNKGVPGTFKEDNYMVPFHIDNGLYLMITPFSNHGLQIQLSNGKVISASNIGSNSVIILFGRGLTDWLLQNSEDDSKKFFPAPHAVPSFSSPKFSYRSVYARMKVADDKAIPYSVEYISDASSGPVRTFEEIFMETETSRHFHQNQPIRQHHRSQLCSTEIENSFSPSNSRWKRNGDAWDTKMKDQCENGTALCWMNCLDLPQECPTVSDSQCIGTNDLPCFDDSMDPACHWQCNPTTTTVKPNTETTETPEKPFCRGGSVATDMNMKGFFSTGQENKPCIILFFTAWELNSELKFGFGCVGVLFLGIMVEACIAIRRKMTSPSKRGIMRLLKSKSLIMYILSLSLFGINLALGYMAMLVAMTYSLELFSCVVFGLIIGHAIFNMKQPVGESIDPCCAPSQNNDGKPSEPKEDHNTQEMRRDSVVSFDGSHGMGDVTRTPCDASINMTAEYDAEEDMRSNQHNGSNKKEGKCCKEKNLGVSSVYSGYQAPSTPIEYSPPPAYNAEEGSTNSEDRSDGDSVVSNSKYTMQSNDREEQGVMMSEFYRNGKLVTYRYETTN